MDIKALDKQYIMPTYARFDVEFVSGKGSLLWDEKGREYIDLGSGIAVNTLGVADERWQEAVTAQLGRIQHTSNLYYTSPQAKLAQALCEKSGLERAFFSNSGAEANECAIKAARKYANDRFGEGKSTVITLKNSFHGRTLATLSATGQDHFHQHFAPFTPGFVHAAPGDIGDLKRLAGENGCCAVMLELIQGEGGVYVLDRDYVRAVEDFARENEMLVIIDEVQTGNGRTGELFCFMRYGISPDIVTTAKGLGGGLPLGATLFNGRAKEVFGAGDHGSTFGGNPICAAGALCVLERVDRVFLDGVREKGNYIVSELSGAKGVLDISGMGLMLGIRPERDARGIVAACLQRGVAALTAKDRIRLLPALNIPLDLLKKAVGILKEEIAK